MQELIVVGMRFQQPAYRDSKLTIGDELSLVLEPDNKANKNAIAVYYKDAKIGYIRDADLMFVNRLDFTALGKKFKEHNYHFRVDRICTNYLRITKCAPNYGYSPLPESRYLTGTGTPKREYEGILSNGDPFVATMRNQVMAPEERARVKDILAAYNNTEPKEEKKMINTNAMRDSFFKEVKNVAMDMQTGKLGVVTKDGIITSTDEGVSVNPITEMGFNIPAFAMRVPVTDLVKGDIIIGSGDPVFFVEGSKVGYMTVTTNGVMQETGSVANMFFGKNTVMAVKNMFGSGDSAGGMNPMLMMAMMGDDKDGKGGFDFKKMMMLQMMTGQGGNAGMGGMNPMLMAMMFSDKL
jgi:hypothetical protein